jgi:hypothetical protein
VSACDRSWTSSRLSHSAAVAQLILKTLAASQSDRRYLTERIARHRTAPPSGELRLTNAHALAHMLNAESLLFDHSDDLQFAAWIETTALPCHANLLGWRMVHLSRCPSKLEHYTFRRQNAKRPPVTASAKYATVADCPALLRSG